MNILPLITLCLPVLLKLCLCQVAFYCEFIQEQGLVIVGGECSSSEEDSSESNDKDKVKQMPKRALVSAQVAGLLETVGEGSLGM